MEIGVNEQRISSLAASLEAVSAGRIGRSPLISNTTLGLSSYLEASKFRRLSIEEFGRIVDDTNS